MKDNKILKTAFNRITEIINPFLVLSVHLKSNVPVKEKRYFLSLLINSIIHPYVDLNKILLNKTLRFKNRESVLRSVH